MKYKLYLSLLIPSMSIQANHPFDELLNKEFSKMHDMMDALFEEMKKSPTTSTQAVKKPLIDIEIKEDGNNLLIVLKNIEMDNETAKINVDDNILRANIPLKGGAIVLVVHETSLSYHAKMTVMHETKDANGTIIAQSSGHMQSSKELPLPTRVNIEKTEAHFKDGILTLSIAKKESKTIPVILQ